MKPRRKGATGAWILCCNMLKGFWENVRDLQQNLIQSPTTKKQQADKERLQRDEGGLEVKRNIRVRERV